MPPSFCACECFEELYLQYKGGDEPWAMMASAFHSLTATRASETDETTINIFVFS